MSNKLDNYGGLALVGYDIINVAPCHVVITSTAGSIRYGGDKPARLSLKIDGNGNIYASVSTGGDIRALVIGCNSAISTVNDFPSDAVYIERSE